MPFQSVRTLPPAPQRGEDFQTFADKANAHAAALTPWTEDVNAAGAYIETTAGEVAQNATNAETAAQSASADATQAAADRVQTGQDRTAAADSAQSAADSFGALDDRYLGAKSSDPSTDNDGDPLIAGALYFNTTASAMRVWSGTEWKVSYATVDYSGAAITELQPGTLAAPKDYVSTDGTGGLVKRNLATDVTGQLQSGEEEVFYKTIRTNYSLIDNPATATVDLDCSASSTFYIFSVSQNTTLNVRNFGHVSGNHTIVLLVKPSSYSITIDYEDPPGIGVVWLDGTAPALSEGKHVFIVLTRMSSPGAIYASYKVGAY